MVREFCLVTVRLSNHARLPRIHSGRLSAVPAMGSDIRLPDPAIGTARVGSGQTENGAGGRSGTAFAPVRGDGGTVGGMWTRTEPVMIGTIRRMPPANPVPVGNLSES